MTTSVLILGAGFGGLELSTRLSDEVPNDVEVTLIDQNDSFVFGFSKLDVMFGKADLDGVRCRYADITKPSVDFRQERILSIDPISRHVVTDKGEYDADILVVALGADYDTAATPGLDEGGNEFYSVAGAAKMRAVIDAFEGGTAIVGVMGSWFKCPPAPNEAAFMLHDHLVRRGVRDKTTIHLVSPLPMPIPISQETSDAIIALLDERDIKYRPQTRVTRIDPATKTAHLSNDESIAFDLLLGIPVHVCPSVVVDAGMTEDDGWIAVDPATFTTKFPGVYAAGDITSAPVPRAGTIAEGEAAVVANNIIATLRGSEPASFNGQAVCYMEMGDDTVGKVNVDFYKVGGPGANFQAPSLEFAREKQGFGSTRRARWFGYDA